MAECLQESRDHQTAVDKPNSSIADWSELEGRLLVQLFPGKQADIDRDKPWMISVASSEGAKCPATVVGEWVTKIGLRPAKDYSINDRINYIHRCIINETRMRLRALNGRHKQAQFTDEAWKVIPGGTGGNWGVEQAEFLTWIDKLAEETLSPIELKVYRMRKVGISWGEIAEETNKSRQTAQAQFRRAATKVRRRAIEIDRSLFSADP